jgi:hypothetical protein
LIPILHEELNSSFLLKYYLIYLTVYLFPPAAPLVSQRISGSSNGNNHLKNSNFALYQQLLIFLSPL